MKYRDLLAVEDIDRDKMAKVVGGVSWGEVNAASIQEARVDTIEDAGTGRAQLPDVLIYENNFDIKNLGMVIQSLSNSPIGGGLPGNNAVKAAVNVLFNAQVQIPPGLV